MDWLDKIPNYELIPLPFGSQSTPRSDIVPLHNIRDHSNTIDQYTSKQIFKNLLDHKYDQTGPQNLNFIYLKAMLTYVDINNMLESITNNPHPSDTPMSEPRTRSSEESSTGEQVDITMDDDGEELVVDSLETTETSILTSDMDDSTEAGSHNWLHSRSRSNSASDYSTVLDNTFKSCLNKLYADLFLNFTISEEECFDNCLFKADYQGVMRKCRTSNNTSTKCSNQLPSHNTIGASATRNEHNDMLCSLCCENIKDVVILPCGHCIMCRSCLMELISDNLDQKKTFFPPCPLCRVPIGKCFRIVL